MRTADRRDLAVVGRLHDKICELEHRVHHGYNLLATTAATRLSEVQYTEARRSEQLNKTVMMLTAFLIAPALVAQFAQALTPVTTSRTIVLLLVAIASILLTWSVLPGFRAPRVGKGVQWSWLFAALALVVTASIFFGVHPNAISLSILVLAVSATTLVASLGLRAARQPGVVTEPPVMWGQEYERWRNDRTKRIAARQGESA
jgi:hypothetical protein